MQYFAWKHFSDTLAMLKPTFLGDKLLRHTSLLFIRLLQFVVRAGLIIHQWLLKVLINDHQALRVQ